jgi:hypothetical protein
VTVGVGGMGWNQATFVRGSQSFFTGFEYDGVPVNRAFDNYVASTESNTGLQELEVYTGGGPAANSSSGTSGFINQVIKTGTYPGYGTLSGGIGSTTYYHEAKVEAGGATPDRRFSWYVGLSGYDQSFRNFDNWNGAPLMQPGDPYSGYSTIDSVTNVPRSDAPLCIPGTGTTPPSVTGLPWFATDVASGSNCLIPYIGSYGNGPQGANSLFFNSSNPALISDRENVVNFHFGIPHKNGLVDDVQALWSASSLNTTAYSSPTDAGGYAPYTLAVTGLPYVPIPSGTTGQACLAAGTCNYPHYVDAMVYNAPFGTPISGLTLQPYLQPSSNPNRAFEAELPATLRDSFFNDTGIVKLQYTHELSSTAYIRAFGYTFFSDWTMAGANSSYNAYANAGVGPVDYNVASANYDLITHTAGGELQFADQINPQNLLQLTGNYTTANVVRFNNDGFTAGSSPIGLVSQRNGSFTCWDPTTGTPDATGCAPGGTYESDSVTGPTATPPPTSGAAAAGAQWVTLWNGNASGSYNTVKPQFVFGALSDQWRPTDKLLINASVRYEDYNYGLNSSAGLATDFYAQIVSGYVCVNPAGTVLSTPLAPGQSPPAPTVYQVTCPAGYSHPHFTANSPTGYTINAWSPRFSATYTQNPDTVWRVSAGRFTQPPISASLQYLSSSGNDLSVWNATLPLGFDSPFHPIPAMSAGQYDLSLEHRLKGTDMSFKITPFYNLTNGYQQQAFIGPNFVTQAPVGQFRSMGVEASFQKGDFSRNGFSGELAATFTSAKVHYQDYYGQNQIRTADTAIQQYNALTAQCAPGGSAVGKTQFGLPVCGTTAYTNPTTGAPVTVPASACYTASTLVAGTLTPGAPTACAGTAIANPYYNAGVQTLIDPGAWYPPGTLGLSPTSNPFTTYYDTPWNMTLLLNYRHQKFAVTPSFQVVQGSSYGGPMDVVGYDPRTCLTNSATAGITAVSPSTNPLQCDYLSSQGTLSNAAGLLYVPNPQTGAFASPGVYRNPWLLVANLQMSYEITPRISAQATLANLWHSCFGGTTKPWTTALTNSQYYCGYIPNQLYVGNFYNGTGPNDFAANGVTPANWQQQSYLPTNGSASGVIPTPFQAYFSLSVRM